MADNQTMVELLQAPTKGYEDAIQRFDESFYEAWDRFNDLLRACPHHGFSELHQLDTFYNALNVNDQDSLNFAAGGIFLDKMTRECLKIIESKSKVHQSRAKAVVAKVSTSSSTLAISSDIVELKDMVRALLLDKKNQSSAPTSSSTLASVKAVNQPPAYQAPAYQAPIPQTQSVSKTDFESYIKANDAVLRNMQNQGENLQIQMANLTDMLSKFVSSNIASSSGSGTLPSNTITNPKEYLKGITPRSGVAYQGPTIPTPSKVVKQGTEIVQSLNQSVSLKMSQLKMTGRALIDVHKGELTLRIGNEAITYNLDQTLRYSANYNQMMANKIDVICEEYSQEVLGFSDTTASGNPTLYDDPIISTIEPLPPLPNHEQYLPSFKKELKVYEAKTVKSSVDEPPEIKLKDLPPHLEYTFLKGDNKLPVIFAKELEDEEKSALIKTKCCKGVKTPILVLTGKRAILWSKRALSSAIRFLKMGLRLTEPKSMSLLNYLISQLSKDCTDCESFMLSVLSIIHKNFTSSASFWESQFLRTTTLLPLCHVYLFIFYVNSLSLYPFTERYAQPYFFSCLIRQMVNNRTNAELSAAVQNALQTLLPQIRAEIREEFRTSSEASDSGGNPPPVTIHTWLERFNKQKPRSFKKATAPVDAEN
nr:reverse transcriptase domain-containing protein [Tanacetum cinerariifolium]